MLKAALILAVFAASASAWTSPLLMAKKASLPAAYKSGGGKKKNPFFSQVFEMDLWKDRADSNMYNARSTKNLKPAAIKKGTSYVPSGLTAAQYASVRSKDYKTSEANYKRNAAKGGVYQNFTAWYTKRGTDSSATWRGVTNGHSFAKTKYDWGSGVFFDGKADAKTPEGIVGETTRMGRKKK